MICNSVYYVGITDKYFEEMVQPELHSIQNRLQTKWSKQKQCYKKSKSKYWQKESYKDFLRIIEHIIMVLEQK